MRHVTVLGASGYLGSAVTRLLLMSRCRVRLVSRRAPHGIVDEFEHREDVEVCQLDLRRPDAVEHAVRDSDHVICLVADLKSDRSWRRDDSPAAESVDFGVLERVIEHSRAAFKNRSVLFASTAALSRPGDDAARTPYELCKRRGERALFDATNEGAVRGASLRLASLVGVPQGASEPGMGAVRAFAERALSGRPIELWTSGNVRRNLVHVDDAAAAVLAALQHMERVAANTWDVGAQVGTPLAEIAGLVTDAAARVTGQPPAPVVQVTPPPTATAHDLTDGTLEVGRFQAATNWSPIRSIAEAIDETVTALAHTSHPAMDHSFTVPAGKDIG